MAVSFQSSYFSTAFAACKKNGVSGETKQEAGGYSQLIKYILLILYLIHFPHSEERHEN